MHQGKHRLAAWYSHHAAVRHANVDLSVGIAHVDLDDDQMERQNGRIQVSHLDHAAELIEQERSDYSDEDPLDMLEPRAQP